MDIKEIANKLNNCAEGKCSECEFNGIENCIDCLLKAMASEVEQIGNKQKLERAE